jgi:pimeloyl-ACP methyl ester carboxylesterase
LDVNGSAQGTILQFSRELNEWITAGETRNLAGYRIFLRTEVTAGRPPLLLIHGYPTASYDWTRIWSSLAERYSLYACDLLGFGMSEKPSGHSYPISEQADICQRLLEAFDVEAPHVLAHDYGDTVAQELLAREREGQLRLSSVVFLNGGLFPETHRPRRVQKLLAQPVIGGLLARGMSYAKFAEAMRSISGRVPPSDQELADLWSLVTHDEGRLAIARLINYMEQRRVNRERWVGALIESGVPRKLICGADDPVSGSHLADRYRELVPDPDVVLLDGVGHYPQLEVGPRVCEEYFSFRDRLG